MTEAMSREEIDRFLGEARIASFSSLAEGDGRPVTVPAWF